MSLLFNHSKKKPNSNRGSIASRSFSIGIGTSTDSTSNNINGRQAQLFLPSPSSLRQQQPLQTNQQQVRQQQKVVPTTQQNRMQNKRAKEQAQQPQQQQKNDTLSSLYADFEELQKQVADTARKNLQTKKIKEQRIKQHDELEKQYASCKARNGIQSCRLETFRRQLASNSRELRASSLHGEHSNDGTRSFGDYLREGLSVVRINNEYRRKIESHLLHLQTKAKAMVQVRMEASKRPKMMEKLRDQTKQNLENLRVDLQSETVVAKNQSARLLEVRSEIATLEQELARTQSLEGHTKAHAQDIEKEYEASIDRQTSEIESAIREIEDSNKAKLCSKTRDEEMQRAIDKVKKEVVSFQERLVQMIDDKDSKRDVEASSKQNIVTTLEMYTKVEENDLGKARIEKQRLLDSVERLNSNKADLRQQEESASAESLELSKSTKDAQMIQSNRGEDLKKLLVEYDRAKVELQSLRESYSDLKRTRSQNNTKAAENTHSLKQKIEDETQTIDDIKNDMTKITSEVESLRTSESEMKIKRETRTKELNREEAQQRLNMAQEKLKEIMTSNFEEALKSKKEAAEEKIVTLEAEIKHLTENNAELNELLEHYTSSEIAKGVVDGASDSRFLTKLVRSCEKTIEAAETQFQKNEALEMKASQRKQKEDNRQQEMALKKKNEQEKQKREESTINEAELHRLFERKGKEDQEKPGRRKKFEGSSRNERRDEFEKRNSSKGRNSNNRKTYNYDVSDDEYNTDTDMDYAMDSTEQSSIGKTGTNNDIDSKYMKGKNRSDNGRKDSETPLTSKRSSLKNQSPFHSQCSSTVCSQKKTVHWGDVSDSDSISELEIGSKKKDRGREKVHTSHKDPKSSHVVDSSRTTSSGSTGSSSNGSGQILERKAAIGEDVGGVLGSKAFDTTTISSKKRKPSTSGIASRTITKGKSDSVKSKAPEVSNIASSKSVQHGSKRFSSVVRHKDSNDPTVNGRRKKFSNSSIGTNVQRSKPKASAGGRTIPSWSKVSTSSKTLQPRKTYHNSSSNKTSKTERGASISKSTTNSEAKSPYSKKRQMATSAHSSKTKRHLSSSQPNRKKLKTSTSVMDKLPKTMRKKRVAPTNLSMKKTKDVDFTF